MSIDAFPAAGVARKALGAAIAKGVYPPGARLPGERVLAAQLEVSRETLRQALRQLADEGVLHASPQRGWFVSTQVLSEPPNELQSFTDMARNRGLTPSTRVLSSKERPATLDDADRLAIAPAAPVLDLRRLRSLDGIPISVDHTTVALGRASALAGIDLNDTSLYGTLERRCGVVVARSDYSVRAEAADTANAELLRLEPGAPVLVGDETTYDLADMPILWGEVVYRGDAYRFQATLYRKHQDR